MFQLPGVTLLSLPVKGLRQGPGEDCPSVSRTSDSRGTMSFSSWLWIIGPTLYPFEYMKCFERQVWSHIMSFIPSTFDAHQFGCRANRSTEDAVAAALHCSLYHLEHQGSYTHLLFIDFNSAFYTILPHRLVSKLSALGLLYSTCLWIKDFVTQYTQRVTVDPHIFSTISISTGCPQGCVLSPLPFMSYTYNCKGGGGCLPTGTKWSD